MHRIDSTNVEADKHGTGKDGWTEGEPGVTAATETTEDWFDAVQEEIAYVIEEEGVTLSKTNHHQLRDGIARLINASAGRSMAGSWATKTAAGSYTGDFQCVVERLIAYNEDRVTGDHTTIIAAGETGEIQSSDDGGETWAQETAAGSYTGTFSGVAANTSLFVLVGASGEIQTSPTGATWTQRTPAGSFSGDFGCIAYGNGTFVTGGTTGGWQYSTNGTSWTQATTPPTNAGYTFMVYDPYNECFIAGGPGADYYARSADDGDTWTELYNDSSGNGPLFLAVSDQGYAISFQADSEGVASTNGFTSVNGSYYPRIYPSAGVWARGIFVVFGAQSPHDVCYGSDPENAADWTELDISIAGGNVNQVCFAPLSGRFVAVGDSGLIVASARG